MLKPLASAETFGAVDADADILLDQCFEDHEAYQDALHFRRFLLLGRKGSGKTAIFKKINKIHAYNSFAYGHTFSDYPWHHHTLQKITGIPDELCFEQSWIYLINITLAKILLNHDYSQPWNDGAAEALAGIESFLLDSYGSRDPDVTQIFQPSKRLRFNPSFGIADDLVKLEINPTDMPVTDLPKVASEVNSKLLSMIIYCLNSEHNYYICFDELDRGFSRTDLDYTRRLIGLLLAAKRVNSSAQAAQKRLNVIIFLRDDIYHVLQFEDKNKITENSSSLIQWDTPGTTHTLRDLMGRRFATVLGIPREGAWDVVFNEAQQMTGHQSKYRHLIDRTMLRPRDMIKLCNECLSAFKADSKGPKIENIHVNAAKGYYSEYLLAEIEDEIHKHIPGWDRCVDLLRQLEAVTFKMEEFLKVCVDRKELLPEMYDGLSLLSQLFEFSIVGYYAPGGKGYGGAQYVFRYKSPKAVFNLNASSYQIHLGLLEALNLKRYSKAA
jgi:hypothetical protein